VSRWPKDRFFRNYHPTGCLIAFADLRASWIDTQLRIAQRAVQIADLQRQNAVLQTQAQTVHAAMKRDCESRHGTLSDVQMPDGAPGETRPECRLQAAPAAK
jgi:hypothetical protein